MEAIIAGADMWMSQTTLSFAFFGSGRWQVPDSQAEVIRRGFAEWARLGIGVDFREAETVAKATVRIGYCLDQADRQPGSWSRIGERATYEVTTDRTMNFGWDLTSNYGFTTVLHEIGHALGLSHEHQNPRAGIVWDQKAVYSKLAGPPNNWDTSTTYNNILMKLEGQQYDGSDWDPESIMEYPFPAGLIIAPAKFRDGIKPPGTISSSDSTFIRKWYPISNFDDPLLSIGEPTRVQLADRDQANYKVHVQRSGRYTISSAGAQDTKLCLIDGDNVEQPVLSADSDLGEERTAAISHRLQAGKTYGIRFRQIFKGDEKEPLSVAIV